MGLGSMAMSFRGLSSRLQISVCPFAPMELLMSENSDGANTAKETVPLNLSGSTSSRNSGPGGSNRDADAWGNPS